MSYARMLYFRNEETVREMERTAESLGISFDEFAEAALRIATLSPGLEGRLERLSERLQEYGSEDLERDIEEFARSEAAYEDPLQSRFAGIQDPHGIGALFARSVERG